MRSEEERVCTPMKTTLARCREWMPALLYNVSRELVLRFVSYRFVSRTNHTSVGVVRDAVSGK